MSLLNYWVGETRALVSVDTQALTPDGSYLETSKLALLPHSNVVIACRGQIAYLPMLYHGAFGGLPPSDFSQVSIWLQREIDPGFDRLISAGIDRGMPEAAIRVDTEVVAVGWSRKENRMRAIGFRRMAGEAKFSTHHATALLAPNAGWSKAPAPNSAQAQFQIAKDQVKFIRSTSPGTPIGGRLLLADLSKDQTTIKAAGFLG